MDLGATPVIISKEDYQSFHSIDRKLYTILVTELWREPVQAMNVMTLWLWLEHMGFRNIVKNILPLPLTLINELVDEALACINAIYGPLFLYPTQSTEINLTHALVQKDISLQFLYENKEAAKLGFEEVNREIIEKALIDLMDEALERNAAQALVQGMARSGIGRPRKLQVGLGSSRGGVHPDDRTMFVTFSKGYPVTELEVRHFFITVFGECIQSFHMQEVQPPDQALYARIIFYRSSIIDVILNGHVKAKLTINGKHVWMRRFIPRSERRLSKPLKAE